MPKSQSEVMRVQYIENMIKKIVTIHDSVANLTPKNLSRMF